MMSDSSHCQNRTIYKLAYRYGAVGSIVYYMRDYIHFYIHYIHYIHSVDSRPQIQQSTFAGDSLPFHLMTSPVHRSLLRACGCLVSVVGLPSLSVCVQDYCESNQLISLKLGVMIEPTNPKNWLTFGGDPVPRIRFRFVTSLTIVEKGIL